MKRSPVALLVAVALVLVVAAPSLAAWAGRGTNMYARTSVYGDCPGSFATWTGPRGGALVLNSECTDPSTSADATLVVSPRCAHDKMNLSCYFSRGGLTALGFDHKVGTYCQGGSPGWDVEAPGGNVWRFACSAGTHTPISSAPGWERITFSAADAQQLAGATPFVFDGSIKPFFMQVLQDEQGCTTLDNLRINGFKIKKGAAGSHATC
ncbi:MAG TPA: hypothetical protein VIF08_06855 [Candidatus Limnocylindrales bacterium]|jgi:hypothetical protein